MNSFSCRHCDVELTIEGAPSGRACRCASCGELNFFVDKSLNLPRQTLAWQSLWLSIVTLLIMVVAFGLLFADFEWTAGMLGPVAVIFGSFAAYWGIKALLRTRYQKTPPSAKVAATIATLLGGCSGVFFGGMFACVFVLGLLLSYFSVETKDPEKVQQIARQYFDVDLPEHLDFVPADADSNPFISDIEYWDDKEFGKSKTRIYVSWMGAMFTTGFGANNRNQLANGSLRRIMGGQRRFVESENTKILVWAVNGEEVEVKKIRWKRRSDADQSGDTFISYQVLTDTESTTYCLTLLCKTPAERLSDEQVKTIFESFDPYD